MNARWRRIRLEAMLVLMMGTLAGGCGKKAGEIFPPLPQPIIWPEPPEPARIMYVGQLATSADLKPPVRFGQEIGQAIFGKRPVRSMLTPYAVCTDGGEQLFVADSNAQIVHVMNLRTRRYDQWAPANPQKRFSQPVGIAYDAGAKALYVADSAARAIYRFDSRGRTIGVIGSEFVQRPCGMAFSQRSGTLFVADAAAHQVLAFSRDGRLIARVGERGTGLGQFNFPTNVALDSLGGLYVSDSLNFRVQLLSHDLVPLRIIGQKGDMPGYFSQPKGLAVDSQNNLYVVDANFEAVQIFDGAGRLLLSFGQEGRGPGEFWLPAGIFIDSKDRIWVADSYNRRVQVFDFLSEGVP